jgi:hypothetical protein
VRFATAVTHSYNSRSRSIACLVRSDNLGSAAQTMALEEKEGPILHSFLFRPPRRQGFCLSGATFGNQANKPIQGTRVIKMAFDHRSQRIPNKGRQQPASH